VSGGWLPWDYGIRNLGRRPLRSGLTLLALALVGLLVLCAVGFVAGLEHALTVSGDSRVVLVHGLGMAENLEYSAIAGRTPDLLAASLPGIAEQFGAACVSPELYLATKMSVAGRKESTGLVRGITARVLTVRRRVQLLAGRWPQSGEVLVGRLAAAKLGCTADELAPGRDVVFEGRTWRISGLFAVTGSVLESEIWCPLEDLQLALKRQDLSLAAVLLRADAGAAEIDLFCKQRVDLELQAVREADYYAGLARHYRPVLALAWLIAVLLAAAGMLTTWNTMYAAVVGRARELATLQMLGFSRGALTASVAQEGLLLAATAMLLALAAAVLLVDGATLRFTMGAFALRIDTTAIAVACVTCLVLGLGGSAPPAWIVSRRAVVDGIRAV